MNVDHRFTQTQKQYAADDLETMSEAKRYQAHVFDLLLRLKANFLWPAMWNNAFAADDPLNPKLADEWGIVMSTSHEEPMMRAEKEWTWGNYGPWDYTANAKAIDDFWTKPAR